MLMIAVVDGQGGGIGKSVVAGLAAAYGSKIKIAAFATNPVAAAAMKKAGADVASSGAAALSDKIGEADVIVGTIGIIAPGSMLGEITPAIAAAISGTVAPKILIPVNKCRFLVAGAVKQSLGELISDAVRLAGEAAGL